MTAISVEQTRIPDIESEPHTYIMMFKPDIYTKPEFLVEAANDITLGLGDFLCGYHSSDFYRTRHGRQVAHWAQEKYPDVPTIAGTEDESIILGIERLRTSLVEGQSEMVNLEGFLYRLLDATGYTITSEVNCDFDDEWVYRLYPFLREGGTDPELQIKTDVRDALKQSELRFLFLEGPLGHEFLDVIKFFMRKTLRDYTLDIINPSESMMHVPDPGEEKAMTFRILRDYFSNEDPQ